MASVQAILRFNNDWTPNDGLSDCHVEWFYRNMDDSYAGVDVP
jgi:hypothetical protein